MKKLLFVCSLALLLVFMGCEYFTGPIGPQGLAGPQGPSVPGVTIEEFNHTITTADRASDILEITDPFFELSAPIEAWFHFTDYVNYTFTAPSVWRNVTRDTLFLDGSVRMDLWGNMNVGDTIHYYKFVSTG